MSSEPRPGTDSPSSPLAALRHILARRPDARDDPEMLRNLLLDRCPTHRSEINWLVNAAAERVPARIAGAGDDTPREVLIGAVKSTLTTDLGMTADAAGWTASTWYDALRGTESNGRPSEGPPAPATPSAARHAPSEASAPAAPAAAPAREVTMDMLRGAQDAGLRRARRGLAIAIVLSAASVVLLLQVPFFADDLFGRLESLRTRDFKAVIVGNPRQQTGVAPLVLYAVMTGVIIAVIRKQIENVTIADRQRRMWSPNPYDWTE